jgi:adenosylcobinamide-GDP ribazoletransferase
VNPFWLAWSFLTIFPAPGQGVASSTDFVRSRIWYPIVGAALGAVWAATLLVCLYFQLPAGITGVVLLASMLWCNGFLHFDGLLDSGDALLCPRSPSERLRILKDVHMGSFAFGVGGLYLLLAGQILSHPIQPLFLVVMPIFSRAILLIPIHWFRYARDLPDASTLTEVPRLPAWQWAIPALVGIAAAVPFWREALVCLVSSLLVCLWASRRLGGGITGDVYGASLLLSELCACAFHVLWRPS